jgi:hypothetical protein
MPRISEDFVELVAYFYRSAHEAKEGINIGGSGFLVGIATDVGPPGGCFLYAVTNRHVIEKADVIRLNTQAGGQHIERLPRSEWTCSPTDDLAVHQISVPYELFAHSAFPHTGILSRERAAKINVGIGDNVFMVGRFINHEGKQQNAPLVRFGAISRMSSEPISYILEGKLHDQESIIADIRSIGGYSGSPVFLNEFPFVSRPGSSEQPDKYWLVGVDWGHIKMWSPVCGLNEEPNGSNTQVNINSGMAAIVPAWKLLDLLMSEKLVKHRKDVEDRIRSAKTTLSAATDISAPPADDANPSHQEDFNQLLKRAAATSAQSDEK